MKGSFKTNFNFLLLFLAQLYTLEVKSFTCYIKQNIFYLYKKINLYNS